MIKWTMMSNDFNLNFLYDRVNFALYFNFEATFLPIFWLNLENTIT